MPQPQTLGPQTTAHLKCMPLAPDWKNKGQPQTDNTFLDANLMVSTQQKKVYNRLGFLFTEYSLLKSV